MKKLLCLVAGCVFMVPLFDAVGASRVGQGANNNAGRVASLMQFQQTGSVKQQPASTVADSAVPMSPDKTGVSVIDQNNAQPAVEKDRREKERLACESNNIGVGNTFVWASRYSNTADYASMVEDVEEPENNVCFVKVDIKSDDSRISTSDVPSKYFQWGKNITCGSWVSEETMEKRILDAKKSGRTWGTVAGAVGGAGLGVGAMELFGNELIGGKVEGQRAKNLTKVEEYQAKLSNLKDSDSGAYDTLVANIQEMKKLCDEIKGKKPSECDEEYLSLDL